ncbi:MAG: hypothetical protein OXT09_27485 [Myxococcales bacterium]|nr:hypothetical protein [Myxococcales bacterium]
MRARTALLLCLCPFAACSKDAASTDAGASGADTTEVTSSSTDGGPDRTPLAATAADMNSQSGRDPDGGAFADAGGGARMDSDGGTVRAPMPLQGYGTTSTFGHGGDVCVVMNLDDQGPGSLRDCVANRDGPAADPTPRLLTFQVGGSIVLTAGISVRQPHLTIDGLSAPSPGITIAKTGIPGGIVVNTWPGMNTCGHDVLLQGLRFQGVWTEDTEDHSQAAGVLGMDGEDLPDCLHNVVFHRLTVINAQDGGGDIWGSVTDATVQYSAFLRSLHPNTYSHHELQARERISNHHNLYAYTHERNPQIRGDVRDSNFEQNILHRWAAYGFGGGYGMRVRCRNGVCPSGINVIRNHFTSAGDNLDAAFLIPEPETVPNVHMAGNRLPPGNAAGTAAEFARPTHAEVTLFDNAALMDTVLPSIGAPHRTPEEVAIFEEVANQLSHEL